MNLSSDETFSVHSLSVELDSERCLIDANMPLLLLTGWPPSEQQMPGETLENP